MLEISKKILVERKLFKIIGMLGNLQKMIKQVRIHILKPLNGATHFLFILLKNMILRKRLGVATIFVLIFF